MFQSGYMRLIVRKGCKYMVRASINTGALIARLRHRVTLRQPQRISDGAGGYSVGWIDVEMVWAEVTAIESDISTEMGQVRHQSRYRVVLRYRPDVSVDMRLGYAGRELAIRSLREEEQRREELILECEEVV